MLRGYGLLLRLVADLVGLGGNEVDELGAAVDHQFPGIVRHADVGERLLDHLIDGSPGDGQVVVVARRRCHPRRHRPTRAAPPRSALTSCPKPRVGRHRTGTVRVSGQRQGRDRQRAATESNNGEQRRATTESNRQRAAGGAGERCSGSRLPRPRLLPLPPPPHPPGRRRRHLMSGAREAGPEQRHSTVRYGTVQHGTVQHGGGPPRG